MKQIFNRLFAGLIALAACMTFAGCGGNSLPDGFDADEVTARAEEIVGFASAADYDSIIASLRDDLKDAVTAEQLESGWAPTYERVGAFESERKSYCPARRIRPPAKSTP
jgi:hypothetical protein